MNLNGVLFANGNRSGETYLKYRLGDSTFFGPVTVPEGDVLGKVFVRFWHLGPAGTPQAAINENPSATNPFSRRRTCCPTQERRAPRDQTGSSVANPRVSGPTARGEVPGELHDAGGAVR